MTTITSWNKNALNCKCNNIVLCLVTVVPKIELLSIDMGETHFEIPSFIWSIASGRVFLSKYYV